MRKLKNCNEYTLTVYPAAALRRWSAARLGAAYKATLADLRYAHRRDAWNFDGRGARVPDHSLCRGLARRANAFFKALARRGETPKVWPEEICDHV